MLLYKTAQEVWFAWCVFEFQKILVLLTISLIIVKQLIFIILLFQQLDANENKSHPDHIQAEANGFTVGNIGSNGRINSPVHKNRLNGVIPRMNMNITPNPMADGDKVL